MVLNKVALAKNFFIAPSEIERLPYWEYEMMRDEAVRISEEERRANEGSHSDNYMSDTRSMMRDMQSSIKKPNIPKLSIPKI